MQQNLTFRAPKRGRFNRSVRLAAQVVPWHAFNFVGFRPVNLKACHSKYQSSGCQAEAFSLLRCGIDFLGQAFTFTWVCHSCSSPRCEMKNPTYVAELQKKLGAPSSETMEGLRLLKALNLRLTSVPKSSKWSSVLRLVWRQAIPRCPENIVSPSAALQLLVGLAGGRVAIA